MNEDEKENWDNTKKDLLQEIGFQETIVCMYIRISLCQTIAPLFVLVKLLQQVICTAHLLEVQIMPLD